MGEYLKKFVIETNAKAVNTQLFTYNNVRFTVITPELLRVECNSDGVFCDEPTQSVINRNFCSASFTGETIGNSVIIITETTKFIFDTFSLKMESVTLSDGRKITDFHKGNLKGTCRTLDGVNGKTFLSEGIISTGGVAVLDDSASLILTDNGKVLPRKIQGQDFYFFAYGYDYINAVKALFDLTGHAPLIPRFTLGNWWSRYKAYTQDEYTTLIKRFSEEKIPLTVATIDMDWHWVDVVKRFGLEALDDRNKSSVLELFYNTVLPGWTGYSWNTELFPDPKGFLKWLKDQDLHITMNLHPSSGCKFYEDAYEDFCEFMEIDKNTKKQIRFDITDEKFIEGYFRFLHHPHEKDGVDFWWIDWQQGKNTAIKGLDPLWALNHYHSLDISRDGKRPLILSRFAGAGSQRYPLGFSGDTVQTWESLDFQPYFTSTASNIAYSWWSHDIGGHCRGYRDDELYLRWLQYGVFSPIMRLHSTSNEFMGKEPWKYNKFTKICSAEFMRLRHRMIPYIYTMNKRTADECRCLIEPMYYTNPRDPRAYRCPNEYRFGSELIVCPITSPCDKRTGLAGTKAYLPKGRFTDILSDRIYIGNTELTLFRDESTIPVLAKEGAIIPLSADGECNSVKNPASFEILVSRGNNTFTLYEDDGETLEYRNGAFCETEFNVRKDGRNIIFTINKPKGDTSVIPENRNYLITFIDVKDCRGITCKINGKKADIELKKFKGKLQASVKNISCNDKVVITVADSVARTCLPKKELKIELFSKLRGDNNKKATLYTKLLDSDCKLFVPDYLKLPLTELDNLFY